MPVTLEACRIYGNTCSGRNPRGGGIHTTAPLTLRRCKVQSNTISDIHADCFDCYDGQNASTFGGGIYSTSDLLLEDYLDLVTPEAARECFSL